jgi:hypothetical protein
MRSDEVNETPELNPAETLVLDEDELAELDKSSLTSIMRDASGLQEMLEKSNMAAREHGSREADVTESDS